MALNVNQVRNIAVTGASGFIGNHLIRFLINRGFDLRALINKTDLDLDVEKFYGSLNDTGVIKKFLKDVDVLFHLATILGSKSLPEREFFRINRDGTEKILQLSADCGVKKVVHFSSAGVYGKSSGLIPMKEDENLNPIDVYERSKMEGEKIAKNFSDLIDVSILRPGWVYGEGDRRTFKLIKQINSGLFFIAGSGMMKHSPVYIKDLIEAAFITALYGKRGEIYNFGGEPVSVKKMVRVIANTLGKKLFPLKIPLTIVYPVAFIMEKVFSLFKKEALLTTAKLAFFMRGKPLNSEKIKDNLKVKAETNFADGMKKTVEWYRKNGWLR